MAAFSSLLITATLALKSAAVAPWATCTAVGTVSCVLLEEI